MAAIQPSRCKGTRSDREDRTGKLRRFQENIRRPAAHISITNVVICVLRRTFGRCDQAKYREQSHRNLRGSSLLLECEVE
jgi:hypothetical protein